MIIWPITEGIPESQPTLVTYNICQDGLYMTKKIAGGGTVTMKIDGVKEAPVGEEKVNFLQRKIPLKCYTETVNFFKYVSEKFGQNLESYVIIGYSNKEDKYCLWVPEQEVAPAYMRYDLSGFAKDNPGYHVVMDIHSHGTMEAFFSGTDDRDDVRDRFSGVIGDLTSGKPTYKFRFSANGKHWIYKAKDLFDTLFKEDVRDWDREISLDFDEAIKKIKKLGDK